MTLSRARDLLEALTQYSAVDVFSSERHIENSILPDKHHVYYIAQVFAVMKLFKIGETLQKRFMFYFTYIFLTIFGSMTFQAISEMIKMAGVYSQPFVALTMPIVREVFIWTGSKLVEKCTNGDEKGAKNFINMYVLLHIA